jgi:hypothetical protein
VEAADSSPLMLDLAIPKPDLLWWSSLAVEVPWGRRSRRNGRTCSGGAHRWWRRRGASSRGTMSAQRPLMHSDDAEVAGGCVRKRGGSRMASAAWRQQGRRGGGSNAGMRPGSPLSRAAGDGGDVWWKTRVVSKSWIRGAVSLNKFRLSSLCNLVGTFVLHFQ